MTAPATCAPQSGLGQRSSQHASAAAIDTACPLCGGVIHHVRHAIGSTLDSRHVGPCAAALSPADLLLLRQLADGWTLAQIARHRGARASTSAAANAASRVYRKLDARGSTHAVAIALRHGLIQ